MGHSTASGRGGARSAADGYLERASRLRTRDELNAFAEEAANDMTITNADYIRIYDAALRRVNEASGEAERRAVENFLSRATNINSANGQQIASNEFEFAGMSNERAVQVLNSMGRTKYELHTTEQPGNFWTNGAPVRRQYIRRRR